MFFKRNYINKAISTVLLVMLLFIHSIKLLHTHSLNQICTNNVIDKNQHTEITKISSDCNICSYQLSKDADDLIYNEYNDRKPEQNIFNTTLTSFHKFSFYSAFENRGPPRNA